MQNIVNSFLKSMKENKRRHFRVIAILLILSLAVSTEVFWMLRQTGITMAGDATCGIEEHTHTDECPDHCDKKEHVHSVGCYADQTADVETQADWQAMFGAVTLTGEVGKDLATIAKTQIGYRESERNFEVDNLGNKNGYTRYGAWYGFPYSDWSAMFVSFCMHFAGSPTEQTPYNIGVNAMATMWQKLGKYAEKDAAVPSVGDLVFMHDNTVGIIYGFYNDSMTVIRGDIENAVVSDTLALTDPSIKGWGLVSKAAVSQDEESTEQDIEKYDAWAVVAEPAAVFGRRSSAMFMSAPESNVRAADTGTMIDMTDMITAVKTEEMINGTWIQMNSGSTLTHGDRLRFTISYTVPKQTLSAENNVIFYNLPANITSVQGASGNVYNETGTVVGTFAIDAETNEIRISFNNEYAEKNQNSAEIVGGVHFITTVDSIFQEGEETEGLIFNDKITIDFEVKDAESVIGDVHVEKTIAEIDGNLITYTVKIISNEGTHTDVTLTDIMTGGLVFGELKSASWGNKPKIDVSSDKTSFTVVLPGMAAGGEYILTYTAELPEGAMANTNLVNNKVDVESTNDKDEPIKDSSDVNHTFNMLNKYSRKNDDGSFTWIIEINASKLDISGWILSDTMSINGVEEAYKGKVTLTDSQGISKQVALPYTFPANSNDSYTVTYTTTHEVSAAGTEVINKAKLERSPGDDKTPIEDEEKIEPGVGEPLRKTGKILGEDENGNLLIEWTVTIDTSAYEIGDDIAGRSDWYIYDKLDDDQYMTYDQLMDAVEAVQRAWASVGCGVEDYRAALYISDAEYEASGSTGSDYGAWQYSQREPHLLNKEAFYERFQVYMDGRIPQGKIISFSYTATAPIKPGVFEYANRINFNGDYKYEVTGEVQYNVFKPTILKAAKYYIGSEYGTIMDDFFELGGESFDSQTQIALDALCDNMLCWMLQIHVPVGYEGDLIITETLPEDVTLKFMQSRVRHSEPFNWDKWTNDSSGAGSFSWKKGEYTVPFEIKDNVVTITIPQKTVKYVLDNIPEYIADENGHRFYFWLWTSIDEDALQWQDGGDSLIKTVPFKNTATMSDGKGTTFGTATQTQVVTKDLYITSVDKFHADSTQDNFVEYAVVLNEDGFDLDPTKDYLEIEDILSYTSINDSPLRVRLVPGSVKLYSYSDAEGFVPAELEFNYTYRESSVADTANNAVIWTNTLSLVIPDSTPVKLVYRYSVTGKEGDTAKLDNICAIVGRYHGSIDDNDHMEFILKKPSATANITSVYIYKVDKDNNGLYLPGAEFNLYMYSKATGQYEPVTEDSTEKKRIFSTDEDGTFSFHFHHDQEKDATAYHLSYDTAYMLEETKAPDGYLLNSKPYEFYIRGSGAELAIPDGYTGHVHETGDLIYYENRKAETEISLEKIWQDASGNIKEKTDGEIAVQLYRKTLSTEGEAYGEPIVLSAANGWKATVKGLPSCETNPNGTAGAEYLYYVKELRVELHTPYYQNNGGINEGKITIINRENVTYALPATGGSGTLLFVLLGIVLIAIPTVYGFISRRKREGRLRG